jgi:hypothetical protein
MIALTRPVSRRTLFALPGRLVPLFLLTWRRAQTAPATIGVTEFLVLSSRLTGKTGLDPKIAKAYLSAQPADQLRRLAGLAYGRQSHPNLEREIILLWYTGTYKVGKESRLAGYREALMWKVMGTPAPGTCGGAFGFWARPPEGAR